MERERKQLKNKRVKGQKLKNTIVKILVIQILELHELHDALSSTPFSTLKIRLLFWSEEGGVEEEISKSPILCPRVREILRNCLSQSWKAFG